MPPLLLLLLLLLWEEEEEEEEDTAAAVEAASMKITMNSTASDSGLHISGCDSGGGGSGAMIMIQPSGN